MTLSIIMPVFNVAPFLGATIDSVLDQTFRDFELILVDDGSTDGSSEICDNYVTEDSRVRVIHQTNSGVSSARNKGVSLAKGNYIGFVDSDDLIEPDMYKTLIDIIESTGADIAQCNHDRVSDIKEKCKESGTKVEIVTGSKYIERMFTKRGADYTNQVSLCTKVFRKELMSNIRFPDGQTYEDEHETYKACLMAHKIALTDNILYHYIRREDSIITGVSPRKMLDKQKALLDRVRWLPPRVPSVASQCYVQYLNYSKQIAVKLRANKKNVECKAALDNLIEMFAILKPVMTRYDKLYLSLIKRGLFKNLILRNDFAPIQKLISKIR